MPGNISASYASPGLRWGLMLEDFPGAYVEFTVSVGTDLGIPARMGGDSEFCVATVFFPDHTGRLPVSGWKSLDVSTQIQDHASDAWNTLCTKALGRALKRAGYPDDTADLKLLVLWRQREAEIGAIKAGTAGLALTAAPIEQAIEAAGRRDENDVRGDDGDAPNTDVLDLDSDEVDVRGDASVAPPSPAQMEQLRMGINSLGPRSAEFTTWAKTQGIRASRPATAGECAILIEKATLMAAEGIGEPREVEPSPDAAGDVPAGTGPVLPGPDDGLVEAVRMGTAGLDGDQVKQYAVFAKSLGVDSKVDPATLTTVELRELLAWLAIDDDGPVDVDPIESRQ